VGVERTKAYRYESLAAGFRSRIFDPLMVFVEPNDNPITYNSHNGQEWNYVVEGKMELHIENNTIVLNAGDSIMFDASRRHGMKALEGKPVRFITVIS
jgi:quercetin dioxygenase-like cupin family protein